MTVDRTDELLRIHGLIPKQSDIDDIRKLLLIELDNQESEDNEYIKTLCIQLFILGQVEDSLLIWKAKKKNFDSFIYIDVQLLCGAGLEQTKIFLENTITIDALDEIAYLKKAELTRDFVEFSRDNLINFYKGYYGIS
ncbi:MULTISPECIES: hypothetical protein [Paenibacillus]|uniref:hypothetical protein n=1 Tax=Paenibacillus TaxID=44249 RepID=UPI0004F61566|nr:MULTISPECIES: hypothetical protein [unclassified Paenibacillus]AIQ30566.1 hypothetical protein P40081_22160 [Paenibacillus sp. FSL P4-0081]OMF30137.1 hypothetical protein BK132_08145 [Paenibacillus sp. FSL H8-0259]